jgi:hypothetical protein
MTAGKNKVIASRFTNVAASIENSKSSIERKGPHSVSRESTMKPKYMRGGSENQSRQSGKKRRVKGVSGDPSQNYDIQMDQLQVVDGEVSTRSKEFQLVKAPEQDESNFFLTGVNVGANGAPEQEAEVDETI